MECFYFGIKLYNFGGYHTVAIKDYQTVVTQL